MCEATSWPEGILSWVLNLGRAGAKRSQSSAVITANIARAGTINPNTTFVEQSSGASSTDLEIEFARETTIAASAQSAK